MNLKPVWNKIRSAWQKIIPDWKNMESDSQPAPFSWKNIFHKSLPYVLVVVFASITFLTALGVKSTNVEHITIKGTMAELEAEKQNLVANQKELEETLNETKSLIAQLQLMNADMETLLEQAKEQDADMAARIEAFMSAYADAEEHNQQRWIVPMHYIACTSFFGSREHPTTGEEKFHYGVDLAAVQGTPVVASRSGTVTLATFEESAGNHVIIDHLDGFTSRYLHMQRYVVSPGQFVMAGQIIGYCGATGVATGSHLHFSIYQNDKAVDPFDYIGLENHPTA